MSYLGTKSTILARRCNHARGKSMDHADCIVRHLVGRGGYDGDVREKRRARLARAGTVARGIERELGLPLPRGGAPGRGRAGAASNHGAETHRRPGPGGDVVTADRPGIHRRAP